MLEGQGGSRNVRACVRLCIKGYVSECDSACVKTVH